MNTTTIPAHEAWQTVVEVRYERLSEGSFHSRVLAADSYLEEDVKKALATEGEAGQVAIRLITVLAWPTTRRRAPRT